MKKLFILISFALVCFSCGKSGCNYNGKPLIKGPKVGCYYINNSGDKEYGDRSQCNC